MARPGAVDAAARPGHPRAWSAADLTPQLVGERLDRVAGADLVAEQVQQGVDLRQRELAMPVDERDRQITQVDAPHGPGVDHHRREGAPIGGRRAPTPGALEPRPQEVVEIERLLQQRTPLSHPLDGLPVECVEAVHDPLAVLVDDLAGDRGQP
jgi:hypothetical protein